MKLTIEVNLDSPALQGDEDAAISRALDHITDVLWSAMHSKQTLYRSMQSRKGVVFGYAIVTDGTERREPPTALPLTGGDAQARNMSDNLKRKQKYGD